MSHPFRLAAWLPLAAALACATVAPPSDPAAAPARPREAADLVLRGGPVMVADEAGTIHEALAVRGDRVLAAGTAAAIAALIGPATRVVELGGRLVTPGFNDAHLHFAAGGISMLDVTLLGTTSLAEIEARVREAAARTPAGEWITGRGWDHTRLPAGELGPGGWPTRAALDRAAPDHPVYLRRVDGHTGWANSAALRLAGVTASTPDPAGGEIVRDPGTGEPTGILKETAQGLVARVVPPPSPDRLRRGVDAALELAAASGVTSIQTDATAADLALYQQLRDEGRLTVRVYAWRPLTQEMIDSYRRLGIRAPFGDAWLRVGLLKAYVDGTLGSRTAYMLEPFSDDPTTRGIVTLPAEELNALVRSAHDAGLQLAIHAIGDGGNRLVLDAIERAAGGARGARHRIEHAQVLDAADIPRFRRLGVIASMQPTHATSDMRWVEERIGRERAVEGAYVWRSLLDAGATVIFGTDFAVEPLPPVEGLYSAVTRQSRERPGEPPGGWIPGERLTLQEAVRLYTAASAYGEFQEAEKGTLEPGMLADLVVWDRDLLQVPEREILSARPILTVVGGRIVFER
jgi:predicted amidohydrolase YtcJ